MKLNPLNRFVLHNADHKPLLIASFITLLILFNCTFNSVDRDLPSKKTSIQFLNGYDHC